MPGMKSKEKEVEKALKALANGRRLRIILFLKKKREASVGEVAEEIRLSFRATSRHLSVLSAADILEREQRGLQVFYRIAKNPPLPLETILVLL